MSEAAEVDQVAPGLFIWQRYDAAVKAELFSTAVLTMSGAYLIDSIPISTAAFQCALSGKAVAGVIVTNANHERATAEFAERFNVAVHSRAKPPPAADISIIEIDGAGDDEIALHVARDGGTMIMGDALINMGSHGFTFLPPKYCSNHKLMQRSLRQLLDYQFERILFAHGPPIVTRAQARLTELLNRGD